MLAYKALYGHFKVPKSYIIAEDDIRYPENVRGMELGRVVINIRRKGYYTDHIEELEAMGFLQKGCHTFAEVKEALLAYKTLFGDLKVPESCIISMDDTRYPENVRGLKLGTVVQSIRKNGYYADHKEELEAMGFLFELPMATFAEVKEALLAYKAWYFDLKVPESYIISKSDTRYPERVRGMKLGNVVSDIRKNGYYADHREELEAMELLQIGCHTFAEVKEALLTYKSLYGDLKVPKPYIISRSDTRYPERVRGMKLRSVVSNIRNQGYYADHKEELEAMGFLYDRQVSTFAEVKEALLTYKALYGSSKVPESCIISKSDTRYPERVRGMELGIIVRGIRNQGYYPLHRKELEAMGFLFDGHTPTFEEVKEALLTYKALYGDFKVPKSYIIAEDDIRYSQNVRKMKLGSVVNNIRNKRTYGSHREELEAMGFLFDEQMATFQKLQ